MQVEVFTAQEQPMETADHEVVSRLIEELGLTGQQKFMATTGEQLQWRRMSKEQEVVYHTLCSESSDLDRFESEVVPLRVLEQAKRAHDSGFFKELKVWASPAGGVKDPVLVGVRVPEPLLRSWEKELYLLARWGEVLLPFEQLRTVALKQLKENWKRAVDEAAARLKVAVMPSEDDFLSGRKNPGNISLYGV